MADLNFEKIEGSCRTVDQEKVLAHAIKMINNHNISPEEISSFLYEYRFIIPVDVYEFMYNVDEETFEDYFRTSIFYDLFNSRSNLLIQTSHGLSDPDMLPKHYIDKLIDDPKYFITFKQTNMKVHYRDYGYIHSSKIPRIRNQHIERILVKVFNTSDYFLSNEELKLVYFSLVGKELISPITDENEVEVSKTITQRIDFFKEKIKVIKNFAKNGMYNLYLISGDMFLEEQGKTMYEIESNGNLILARPDIENKFKTLKDLHGQIIDLKEVLNYESL